MAVEYFGQRQVEVGSLNASFEPIRLRLAGKADPLTPRTLAKVRLHVPDEYLTHRGRRRSPASQPSPERREPRRDASKSPEENRQDVFESCIKQAIGKAGFGAHFEQLPIDEKRNVLRNLRQGFITQMQTIFQSRSTVPNVQSPNPAPSRESVNKVQSSSQQPRRAATSPELEVRQHQRQQSNGQSHSKKRPQELQRQSEKEASMQASMISCQQAVPWAIHAALASEHSEQQTAQDHATPGSGTPQPGHPPQQHQQPQFHQQVHRPLQLEMRPRVNESPQVKTWPELPIIKGHTKGSSMHCTEGYESEKGSQGKGKRVPYGRVNSMSSLHSTTTTQSTQDFSKSMDSLPWPSENTAHVSTQSIDSLPRMIVRSMDSLPHVAVNTMDSLPEIAESGSEDAASLFAFSQRSMPFPQLGGNQARARKFFAPQTRTCPDLPDFREGADSWPRASSTNSLPHFERELDEQSVDESVPSKMVNGVQQIQHSGFLQQTNTAHMARASAMAELAMGFDSSSGHTSRPLQPGPVGPLATAGDMSAAQGYVGAPPGLSMPISQPGEPNPPPLPLGLLVGSSMTFSL